jgi:hypothetical protein
MADRRLTSARVEPAQVPAVALIRFIPPTQVCATTRRERPAARPFDLERHACRGDFPYEKPSKTDLLRRSPQARNGARLYRTIIDSARR